MKTMTTLIAAVAGLALLPAFAQETVAPGIIDTDANGTWSLTELQTAYPDLNDEGFASIDANTDGAVDQAELAAALADGLLPATAN